jgi:uncharacterized protein
MDYLRRDIQNHIEKYLFRKKIIFIHGPRQVGKTTLALQLLDKFGKKENYYNCELLNIKQLLESKDPYLFKKFIGNAKFIILDEAHTILDIGKSLKLIYDTFPDIQMIVTGSSSFELRNKSNEPLTGRAFDFMLLPFSLNEVRQKFSNVEILYSVNSILRFGLYPDIFGKDDDTSKITLDNLTSRYLYKDILEFETIKKSDKIIKLLQLLSFQVGNEVSINELSKSLGINRTTVERYLDLLEKSYVIFRLKAFSRNLRNEISKREKYFFYDLGIRNSLISLYNPLDLRNDIGALWENFCIIELMKKSINNGIRENYYFWRNVKGEEIDLIVEKNGLLTAYEIKWKKEKIKYPKDFFNNYKNSEYNIITQKDILKYFF